MKMESNIKKVISNTFTVVARRNLIFFITSLITFSLLYLFFYGVFTVPILEIGFFKDVKPDAFDYFYIFSSSILSALIVTLTKYSIQKKALTRGLAFFGVSTGLFGAICPVCLGVNFLVFGNFITVPLVSLIPYLFWIQIAGLILLTLGLVVTVKYSYENICLACTTEPAKERKVETSIFGGTLTPIQNFVFFGFLILAILALGYQILPFVFAATGITGATVATDEHKNNLDLEKIISQVLPEEGFTIDVTWKDSISKMVKAGVLDIDKLNNIMTKRYGQPLTEEQKKLLTSEYSNEKLTINSKNAVFMMYILWTLAKHNDNPILHDSPFAQYFQNYDIGVGRAGYGDVKLIELTPEQQEIAKYVALNSYRPCCGNPTGHPDCSHGFAALGLIELMASQGYNKKQIFDAFVKFNSYWFPATYIQDALYFKLVENKDWNDVDRELIAGKQYSSISGSYAVKQYLQNLGL
ncbi:MAG: hypothetical protein QXP82_02590 [Candidatus Aenigmatarchaeota archaeon]|nr:hypothetical protein [Candidatus Aenigmarchaeota archaeon]